MNIELLKRLSQFSLSHGFSSFTLRIFSLLLLLFVQPTHTQERGMIVGNVFSFAATKKQRVLVLMMKKKGVERVCHFLLKNNALRSQRKPTNVLSKNLYAFKFRNEIFRTIPESNKSRFSQHERNLIFKIPSLKVWRMRFTTSAGYHKIMRRMTRAKIDIDFMPCVDWNEAKRKRRKRRFFEQCWSGKLWWKAFRFFVIGSMAIYQTKVFISEGIWFWGEKSLWEKFMKFSYLNLVVNLGQINR